jgi:vacuolar-type H+-ATPase subunit H
MPPLRDFLARFRPAGAPGAAARAGVPADRSDELAAEVAPVLALLDDTTAERERLIGQARHDAEQIVTAARSAADAIGADAARRAEVVRQQAAQQAVAAARKQAAKTTQAATLQATQIRELARRRMPDLVSHVVGTIRQLQGEDL